MAYHHNPLTTPSRSLYKLRSGEPSLSMARICATTAHNTPQSSKTRFRLSSRAFVAA